jgi:hypothetical protein
MPSPQLFQYGACAVDCTDRGARITTNAISNLPEDLMAAERELLTLNFFLMMAMWIFVDILLCGVSVVTTNIPLIYAPNILFFVEPQLTASKHQPLFNFS